MISGGERLAATFLRASESAEPMEREAGHLARVKGWELRVIKEAPGVVPEVPSATARNNTGLLTSYNSFRE